MLPLRLSNSWNFPSLPFLCPVSDTRKARAHVSSPHLSSPWLQEAAGAPGAECVQVGGDPVANQKQAGKSLSRNPGDNQKG